MRRLIKITLTTMVVTAAVTSAAGARSYVSPDARDSGRHLAGAAPTSNLNGRDLVSPDARDSARNRVATYQPGRAPIVQPQQPVLLAPSNGFSWGDAGIGAAGMLALIALVAGTLMIGSHRRRGPLATN